MTAGIGVPRCRDLRAWDRTVPCYCIDVDGGERPIHDGIGSDRACTYTARRHAIAAVTTLAQTVLVTSDARDLTVKITNEIGEPIYEALLSFRGGWIGAVP